MRQLPALVTAFAAIASLAHASDKPNIIYILADDMGPGDVKAYNEECRFPTPGIDRLAGEGMLFMDAHTSSGVCTPTRYGILTGRYSWRTHLKGGVLQGHSPHLIDTNRETVASYLKERGYATACVGKWHLGMDWTSTDGKAVAKTAPRNVDFTVPVKNGPQDVGFDDYFGISASLNMDPHAFIDGRSAVGTLEFVEDTKAYGLKGAKKGWVAKEFEQDQVLPTFARKACEWIREHADQPFFLYLPLNSPHSPIVPSEDFEGKSGLSPHGDFCMETDWAVVEILRTLDELELMDNTIVIFTADNGTSPQAKFAPMQAMGHYPSWIYRGLKGTNWEGGHRVPFVVRWPAGVEGGSRSDAIICTTDLLATVADILGETLPDNAGEDSVSFLPALKGEAIEGNADRGIIHHSDVGVFAIRRGKWKLHLDNRGGSRRTNPKDPPVINSSEFLLFDMEADVAESTNLSDEHPEVVHELKQLLADLIQQGRSSPGQPQANDPARGKEWRQLKPIADYLD
jgi:arylsulfatase A-like enzyme